MPSETSTWPDVQPQQRLAQLVDPPVAPGELGERPAEHRRDVVLEVGRELGLERLGDQRRAPAEPDHVHVRGRDLHQARRLDARQARVDHVRDAGPARLLGARRQRDQALQADRLRTANAFHGAT